jgi:hypothetical protein
MNYFAMVKYRHPIPCTHPLLLSLTEAFNESSKSPNIGSVSEDDPRVLRNPYYTSPKDFPVMNVHLSGQNGVPQLSESLISALQNICSRQPKMYALQASRQLSGKC